MRKMTAAQFWIGATSPVFTDSVSPNALLGPHVVPIARGGEQLRAPMVISNQQNGVGICNNSQQPFGQANTYGFEVKLAVDDIAVGGAVLGLMYLLGSSTATN